MSNSIDTLSSNIILRFKKYRDNYLVSIDRHVDHFAAATAGPRSEEAVGDGDGRNREEGQLRAGSHRTPNLGNAGSCTRRAAVCKEPPLGFQRAAAMARVTMSPRR